DLEVHVGTGRETGHPRVADDLAGGDVLADRDPDPRLVPVQRRHAVAVVDHHRVPVAALWARDHDRPGETGVGGRPRGRREVVAGVEDLAVEDRVHAVAVRARDAPGDGAELARLALADRAATRPQRPRDAVGLGLQRVQLRLELRLLLAEVGDRL